MHKWGFCSLLIMCSSPREPRPHLLWRPESILGFIYVTSRQSHADTQVFQGSSRTLSPVTISTPNTRKTKEDAARVKLTDAAAAQMVRSESPARLNKVDPINLITHTETYTHTRWGQTAPGQSPAAVVTDRLLLSLNDKWVNKNLISNLSLTLRLHVNFKLDNFHQI